MVDTFNNTAHTAGKQAYLDALRRAMTGLPPETQAKTLGYYEQRFIDGVAAGRSEEEVSQELDDPKKIAMTLRASAHLQAFKDKRNPADLLRMTVSAVGLLIFNLFMVVPAMVYAAMLAAVYFCALAFYLAGIVMCASGLSGVTEVSLDGPLRYFIQLDDGEAGGRDQPIRVSISQQGVEVFQDADVPPDERADDAPIDVGADLRGKLLQRAEAVAGNGVHITSDLDTESRTTQTLLGFGFVLLGIALCLLSLVVTRYTLSALRRYVHMNFSLLRGR